MAEAEVVGAPMRYFCHVCNLETRPNPDITCSICSGGFIEELPTAQPSSDIPTPPAGTSTSAPAFNIRRDLNSLRSDLQALLVSRNGNGIEISIGLDGNNRSLFGGALRAGNPAGGNNNSNTGSTTVRGNNVAGGRVRPQNLDRLDNVLMDVLQTLTMGDVDGLIGNSQLLFMGNPGDYAWGREGIDTIVTQLLNQMETSGSPPLTKEKIAEIPIEKISAEEVNEKMSCSVCWDDFKLEENVRRLPCTHIYHEDCIIPWLNLHNTCPICRTSLADPEEPTQVNQQSSQQTNTTGMRLTRSGLEFHPIRRNNGPANSGANTHSNRATNSGNSSTAPSNNIFGFDDKNKNLDMDLD